MDCLPEIAHYYNVPENLIRAVIQVESNGRNVNSKPNKKDGSIDRGYMQINDFWLPHLLKLNISESDLKIKCTNIAVGTWILKYNFNKTKSWPKAVASYNTGFKNNQSTAAKTYTSKVYKVYNTLESK